MIAGMHRQGYDVQLTQYDERGWRATFYLTGMEHSATSSTASAWETTPWRAVHRLGRDVAFLAECLWDAGHWLHRRAGAGGDGVLVPGRGSRGGPSRRTLR